MISQNDHNLDIYGLIILTGDFLSIALITNFLSLKEIFLISLQGKPILGVILQKNRKYHRKQEVFKDV